MVWTSLPFSKGFKTETLSGNVHNDQSVDLRSALNIVWFGFCRPLAQQEFFTKPKFSHVIQPGDCLATPCDVISLNMYTLQIKDLEVLFGLRIPVERFIAFKLRLSASSQEITGQFHFPVEKSGTFHGFTAWFAVYFESLEVGGATVELNTGPNSE